MTMEEGERDTPSTSTTPQNKGPPSSTSAANGRLAGSGGKGASPPERSGGGGGAGFAGIAKMLSSKAKGQGPKGDGGDGKGKKQNGCEDDLPLGSEAHSLSFEHTNGIDSKGQAPAEKRSRWSKTVSQGMMGWQSFNSDASNQTSASSASLEMLLNERQMDPEEMLLNLGFGGQTQTYVPSLARVPERFLVNPSRAYGIAATGNSEEGGEEVAEDSNTTSGTPQTGGGGGGTTSMAAAAGAAAPPPKKRTGGFYFEGYYFWPCEGYVDLISLLNKDVPLSFFNDEGTKCYIITRSIEELYGVDVQSEQVQENNFETEKDANKIVLSEDVVREKNDNERQSMKIRLSKKGKENLDISVSEPSETSEIQTGMLAIKKDLISEKPKSPQDDVSKPERKSWPCAEKSPSEDHPIIETETLAKPKSEEQKPKEKGFSKFLDMKYVKLAAKKIGDTISKKIHRKHGSGEKLSPKGREASSSPERRHGRSKSSTSYKSPTKRQQHNLSSSYSNLTARLRVTSLIPGSSLSLGFGFPGDRSQTQSASSLSESSRQELQNIPRTSTCTSNSNSSTTSSEPHSDNTCFTTTSLSQLRPSSSAISTSQAHGIATSASLYSTTDQYYNRPPHSYGLPQSIDTDVCKVTYVCGSSRVNPRVSDDKNDNSNRLSLVVNERGDAPDIVNDSQTADHAQSRGPKESVALQTSELRLSGSQSTAEQTSVTNADVYTSVSEDVQIYNKNSIKKDKVNRNNSSVKYVDNDNDVSKRKPNEGPHSVNIPPSSSDYYNANVYLPSKAAAASSQNVRSKEGFAKLNENFSFDDSDLFGYEDIGFIDDDDFVVSGCDVLHGASVDGHVSDVETVGHIVNTSLLYGAVSRPSISNVSVTIGAVPTVVDVSVTTGAVPTVVVDNDEGVAGEKGAVAANLERNDEFNDFNENKFNMEDSAECVSLPSMSDESDNEKEDNENNDNENDNNEEIGDIKLDEDKDSVISSDEGSGLEWCYDGESLTLNQVSVTSATPSCSPPTQNDNSPPQLSPQSPNSAQANTAVSYFDDNFLNNLPFQLPARFLQRSTHFSLKNREPLSETVSSRPRRCVSFQYPSDHRPTITLKFSPEAALIEEPSDSEQPEEPEHESPDDISNVPAEDTASKLQRSRTLYGRRVQSASDYQIGSSKDDTAAMPARPIGRSHTFHTKAGIRPQFVPEAARGQGHPSIIPFYLPDIPNRSPVPQIRSSASFDHTTLSTKPDSTQSHLNSSEDITDPCSASQSYPLSSSSSEDSIDQLPSSLTPTCHPSFLEEPSFATTYTSSRVKQDTPDSTPVCTCVGGGDLHQDFSVTTSDSHAQSHFDEEEDDAFMDDVIGVRDTNRFTFETKFNVSRQKSSGIRISKSFHFSNQQSNWGARLPSYDEALSRPICQLKRRTSTGSVKPWPNMPPSSSLPSSPWLLPLDDDFDKLSDKDKEELDMSNVSTSSSDSEDEDSEKQGGSFSRSFSGEETLV